MKIAPFEEVLFEKTNSQLPELSPIKNQRSAVFTPKIPAWLGDLLPTVLLNGKIDSS